MDLRSSTYRMLIGASRVERFRGGWRTNDALWRLAQRVFHGDVRYRLHGRELEFNFGHPYPLFLRRSPLYNAPLVAVVETAASLAGRPVSLVDVGAGFGDTLALLDDELPGAVGRAVCIEPFPVFLRYLRRNYGDDPRVEIVGQALGEEVGGRIGLAQHHAGTAAPSRSGSEFATAVLDEVVDDPDVLKTDCDGFDGAVLAGAPTLLRSSHPWVIFEFHPVLADAVGAAPTRPFALLRAAGYRTFVLFDKTGPHVTTLEDPPDDLLDSLAEDCRRLRSEDAHYDVAAVPSGREGVVPSLLTNLRSVGERAASLGGTHRPNARPALDEHPHPTRSTR
jgi:FkbM family methyltransferase